MNDSSGPVVIPAEGGPLNGLGMTILQYIEQNLAEFDDKALLGRRLRGVVSVEVEKGVAVTLRFLGDRIIVENGVAATPDLHLKSSYLLLSKVLTGSTGPLREILRGGVRLGGFPKRPLQALRILRFLKVPAELLVK